MTTPLSPHPLPPYQPPTSLTTWARAVDPLPTYPNQRGGTYPTGPLSQTQVSFAAYTYVSFWRRLARASPFAALPSVPLARTSFPDPAVRLPSAWDTSLSPGRDPPHGHQQTRTHACPQLSFIHTCIRLSTVNEQKGPDESRSSGSKRPRDLQRYGCGADGALVWVWRANGGPPPRNAHLALTRLIGDVRASPEGAFRCMARCSWPSTYLQTLIFGSTDLCCEGRDC